MDQHATDLLTAERSDAQRWLDTGIPKSFWMELRETGLVREDAPLPAAP
jgi:hypothetical protein